MQGSPRRRIPRWVGWLAAVVLVVLVALAVAGEYVARNAEPILRRRVIATLEDRFHRPVELDALHISVVKGLEVSGSGLRILSLPGELPELAGGQANRGAPVLSATGFEFRTSLRQLWTRTMHVDLVRVQGMQVNVPPRQNRGRLFPRGEPKEIGRTRTGLIIDKVECRDVTLSIETDKPGKLPLEFDIGNVTLHDVGEKKPFAFEAWLLNPKPIGNIHSWGHFGPWQSDQPRDTPVDGAYSFTNADLDPLKGISGTLSSTGNYGGTLGEINVDGTTDTPNFSLDVSQHPVHLRTVFNATVDGTTGDTKLNSVRATLLHTVLQVSGMVIRAGDARGQAKGGVQSEPGHFIDISVASDQARVEDLLTLGAKTSPALMRGALTLRAHLAIPPGKVSVSKKMRVQGKFTIRDATLTNPKWQDTVDKLSARASGHPREANAADAAPVSSEVEGTFALADALLKIGDLQYQIPGAQLNMAGQYSLDGNVFDFDGTVRTKATASEMLTGWKSIVAIPFDPLFKKNGAGLQVPIKISGTKSDPKIGLDLNKLGAEVLSRHKDKQPEQSPGPPAPTRQPTPAKQPDPRQHP